MEQAIHKILSDYWGYTDFREKQEEIIQSVLNGSDTLALLPTGGGKSICFQVPTMVMEGMCLVISPLIALMEDQVQNLKKKGIKAMAISSAMSRKEIDIAIDNAAYGGYKFLYLSPERIQTEIFQARLEKMNICLLAIDEAHCISQWGYDFRPAYLQIAELRQQLKNVPVLALTATATPKVVEDIQKKLSFQLPNVIRKSFHRENLSYVVLQEENMEERMLKVIQNVGGSGIVYCNRRLKCKQIASYLRDFNIQADFYHGGLDHATRSSVQKAWIQNQLQVVVATNAFGMGIDKPDVRFVIHMDYPNSLEAYYQEAGRGGRDGKRSYAVLIANESQAKALKEDFEKAFPSIKDIKKVYLALSNFLQIPLNGGEGQSFPFPIGEFSKRYNLDTILVFKSLEFLQKEGLLSLSEGFYSPSKLHFTMSKEGLYKFQVSHKSFDILIKTILRAYGGLFEDYGRIDEKLIAHRLNTTKEKVVHALNKLQEMEVLDFLPANDQAHINFTKARIDQRSLIISKENYKDRKQDLNEKMEAVLHYTQSTVICRSKILLSYFGESDSVECGHCDICLEKKKTLSATELKEVSNSIKIELKNNPLSLSELIQKLNQFQEKELLKALEHLLNEEKLEEKDGKFQNLP